MTIPTTTGLTRAFAIGVVGSALLACAPSSGGSTPASSGGATSSVGTGGSPTGGAGLPVSGSGGAPGTGGAVSSGGATVGTGGADAETGGATPASGGAGFGSGGMGVAGGGPGGGVGGIAAGGAAGGGSDNCNGAALCDSFERAMLGPDWVVDKTGAATVVELVTNKGHTGTNSVHVTFDTASMAGYIDETKTFPAMDNAFWGRIWIWAANGVQTSHSTYIEARVGVGDRTGVRVLNTLSNNLASNLESSDASKGSNIANPVGKWVCYEWQITGIGGTGNVHVYMDGTELTTLAATGWMIPKLAKLRVGYQRFGMGGPAGEVWLDDVGVGSQRIGCM